MPPRLSRCCPWLPGITRDRADLLLLEIDPARLTSELKWEPPTGGPLPGVPEGDAFPHIYGPINLDAVIQVVDFELDENGDFTLPTSLNRGG